MLYRADKPLTPEEPMPPGKLFQASLRGDWGLEIDCADIRNYLLSGMAPSAPTFIKGWVVTEVTGTPNQMGPRPLDVTAVYTPHGWNQSGKTPAYVGFAEDVEQGSPEESQAMRQLPAFWRGALNPHGGTEIYRYQDRTWKPIANRTAI